MQVYLGQPPPTLVCCLGAREYEDIIYTYHRIHIIDRRWKKKGNNNKMKMSDDFLNKPQMWLKMGRYRKCIYSVRVKTWPTHLQTTLKTVLFMYVHVHTKLYRSTRYIYYLPGASWTGLEHLHPPTPRLGKKTKNHLCERRRNERETKETLSLLLVR